MIKFLKRFITVTALLLATNCTGYAASQTIWNSTHRSAASTNRLPVDTSSSSSPGYNTPNDILGVMTGDCTTTAGAITCTKTGGVGFGALATQNIGGTNGQIQYNNNGAFGGISPFHGDYFEWQLNSPNDDNAIASQADSLFTMLAEIHGAIWNNAIVYAAGSVFADDVPVYNNGTAGVGATITAVDNGVFTLDGVTPPLNSLVLILNGASTATKAAGVYKVTDAGSISTPYVLTRDVNWDTPAEINEDVISFYGYKTFVAQHGNNKQYAWYLTAGPITNIGVDDITYQSITNINGMIPMDGLTSGKFYVGNSSAVAAQVSMSGDATMDNAGAVSLKPLISKNTKFTITGCTAGTTIGGAQAGSFVSGTTGTCTVTITINGATGSTAPNGWACWANDQTTPSDIIHETASDATTVTLSGSTLTSDVISFGCMGY